MRLLIEAKNASIAIDDEYIVEASGRFDVSIRLQDGEVRPGLINGHDHLHRNHYGRLGSPPYMSARQWAHDIQHRFANQIALGRKISRQQSLRIGAWKNLLSGVTHVVHHDPWEPAFEKGFPLHVVRVANADSIAMAPDLTSILDAAADGDHIAIHVAEGIDGDAASEVHALHSRGLLNSRLLAVHAVGPDPGGVELLEASGCAIVWCPTSNHFLFGRSAPERLIADGTDIILGTDSLLTGAGDILDEVRFARSHVSGERLIGAVSTVPARRLGFAEPSLAPGAPADIVLLHRPLLEAGRADVAMVMVDGEIRVLDPALLRFFGFSHGRILDWRGVERWISPQTAAI